MNKKTIRYTIFFLTLFFLKISLCANTQNNGAHTSPAPNNAANTPRVSIITSIYKGDPFIEGFLYDITQQTIFAECELIIIDANSPGSEEMVIRKYMARYPNIIYERLDHDPGIYGVWNKAIEKAKAPYITNANVDDRFKHDCYEVHARALDAHPEIDLVYSDFFITHYPNETFYVNRHESVQIMPQFSTRTMRKTLPNNHPMWRKSMHEKYGFFDESYKHAGDWEMWLRAVKGGAKFLKVPGVYSLFYYNPRGLSTDARNPRIAQEERKIYWTYRPLFLQ
jgi:glycosyltransferase involved in cell wall biosynthesis